MPKKQANAASNPHKAAWNKLMATGRYIDGRSTIFLKRSKVARAIAQVTGRGNKPGDLYLPNIGFGGAVAHAVLSFVAGKPHIWRKRSDVLKAIRLWPKAQPHRFNALVLATARFLYDNHLRRQSPIFDKKAEPAIFEEFGRLAQQSTGYKQEPNRSDLMESGKQFFRHIIRNDLLGNFEFVLNASKNPEKMAALKYGLVGEVIDPLTEQSDLERLQFATSVFSEDIPAIERHHAKKPEKKFAFQAMIRIQAKAIRRLANHNERIRFYEQVCRHYGINQKEVDEYAYDFYFKSRQRMRAKKEFTNAERHAMELNRQIEEVYGEKLKAAEDVLKRAEKKAGKKKKAPLIILSPGAQFEIEKARRNAGKQTRDN